jgi:hypothetical protein
MPETKPTKRKTTRQEKISKPAVYETPVTQESLTVELTKLAQKVLKPKNPPHRPVEFTEDIADEICWRITHGEPLVRICADEHLPHVATIYRWLIRFPTFCDMYTRAREEQADTNADEILAIADEMPPEYTDEKGRTTIDHSYLAWQKQRIEARKWTASKLKPRKYGDRVAVEGVEGGASIKTEDASADKFLEIIKNMEMTKRAG